MRTQAEIKKNNIRKANLLKEHTHRTNKGRMNTNFGLFEQCGGSPRDTEGVYMGAPAGTEPMNDMMGMDMGMMGNDMMGNDMMGGDMIGMDDDDMPIGSNMGMMDMMDDDDMPMDDEMMMMFMNEDDVVGVDQPETEDSLANYEDEDDDDLMEHYKAFTATPKRDSWGNEYNQILTENTQVNGVNSLIHRMKRVIK